MKLKSGHSTLSLILVAEIGLSLAVGGCASQESLKSEAKISREAAMQTARAKVPKGKIKSSELEKEHGKLIWSFDISMPGSANITESRCTPRRASSSLKEIETPAQQAKEAAADQKEKK